MMKVLFISHACISFFHQEKLKLLGSQRDIELFLVTPQWWQEGTKKIKYRYWENLNFKHLALPTLFTGKQFIHFYLNLSKYLKNIKPDIMHIEEEPHSVACFQALWLKNRLGLNAKTVIFSWQNMFQQWRLPNVRYFIYPFCEKYSLQNADYIIAGSQTGKEIFSQKGFKGEISVLAQFGVNTDEFRKIDVGDLRQQLGINKFVIGYIGRLLKMKGICTLLEAAARLQGDCQLLIIGSGPEKLGLKRYAEKLGIKECVIFVESIEHCNVPLYLNCMDVLVLPSEHTANWREQFGRVLIEAMACQVAVIGSSCGEIPNVIADAGLVFEEGDSQDLWNVLHRLISNANLRAEIAKKGRERVLGKFTNEHIAQETHKIYSKLFYQLH
ncbi:MAG: glycosyltransferase [Candidatus Omnitrophota bacterium]|nr:glycosyltransferase [Candidatus Omnitrophota bacterium]